ncbi:putative Octicosapeptide/Phox/Bem1p family protein [Quillaja saponaria]|uniref:Octicosapeptide/Phox/Bem1p family protein n=1 Tax=Quillaja saponaria TaxID=32244 RepID=A0AAD7Q5Z9_QUISA|nr:putative Octicosapeptide/Phox/Bem1p family protein [Quillaja saponaria]
MDPPPPLSLPPHPNALTTSSIQLNYPDSADSSPRSHNADNWADEHLPPVPGATLRLMCSYGGHIIPRPHDKSLCYVGGDTRIVVVDRHSSLADLCSRLSRTLINGRSFNLKYQLPNEEIDSLISVTTNEDLENMIEEYDRITAVSPLKPSRLRLFLFFCKPETAASMGILLDDAKSETWFVDALNNAGLPRGLSDSATLDCLMSLDGVPNIESCNDLEAQAAYSLRDNNKQVKDMHEVHSIPNSPKVENNSSYGSSSSSPSMSNLPPIRVRVDDNGTGLHQDQKAGIEEQFAQMTFSTCGMKQEDGFSYLSAPMASILTATTVASGMPVSGDNENRVFSDDERSDQGAPVGFRKPPLPLQPVQTRTSAGFGLPSPDSVASDSSIASANSFSKPDYYQVQVHGAPGDNRGPPSPNTKSDISDPSPRVQMQLVQDSGYTLPPQFDQQQQHQHHQQQQQQFVHASMHYIHNPATGPVPMSSYYQVYAPPPPQQQLHHPIDQQYPVYVMPVAQTQPYDMNLQPNLADTTVVGSSRPLLSQAPATVAASAAYKDGTPPIYPTKTANPPIKEGAPSMYKTAVALNPSMVQIPSNQFQQQYVGFSQMHHPAQSIAVACSAISNYGYEYVTPSQDQVYYTQHQAAPLPPVYQSMTPAAAMALSDASKQLPTDNTQQKIRTPQPL